MNARFLSLFLALFFFAAAPVATATIAGIVAPTVASKTASDESDAKLRDTLEGQITGNKEEQKRFQSEAQALAQSLKEAPALIASMRAEAEKAAEASSGDKLEKLTVVQLNDRLNQWEAQQRVLEASLAEVYQQITQQQNVPTQAREKIATLQTGIDEAEKRIQSLQGATDGVQNLKHQLALSERDRLMTMRDLAASQLDGYQKMMELHTAQRDLLTAQLNVTKSRYAEVQARIDLLRRDEVARQQAAFADIEQALAGMPQVVIDAAIVNRKHNDQLIFLQIALRDVVQRDKQYGEVSQEVSQRSQIAAQQLEIGGFNRFYMEHVRYITRTLRPLLNEVGDENTLHAELVDARAKQFTYDDQLRELRSPSDRQKKMERMFEKLTPEERARADITIEIQKLLAQRETLLETLSQTNGNYVVALTNFELSRKKLKGEESKFMSMLNQKMVWLHASPPMGWDTLLTATKGAYGFFRKMPWSELPLSLNGYRKAHPWQTLLALLTVAGLLYGRGRLLRLLDHMAESIGKVGRDKFRYTLQAVAITLIAALPVPLSIALLGSAMMDYSPYQSFPYTVGELMLRLSPLTLMIALLPVMTCPNGLAALHFGWNDRVLVALRKQTPWLIVQLPLFALGVYVIDNASDQRSIFVFGRVVMAIANLTLAFNCWMLLRPGKGLIDGTVAYSFFDKHWRERFLWMPLLIGLPLYCAVLVVVGYDFTVVFFARMFYVTFFAGFGIYLAHQVFTRWFAVQERKIALDRALAKRAADRATRAKEDYYDAAAEGLPDLDGVDEINLETISERNRALLKVIAYSVFVSVLWRLWGDVAPALDVLDKYVLWNINAIGDSGQIEQVPITLWRFLCACFVLIVTVVAGRNLPGLVETVLLQRFHLENSIRFAITTVARYCIFGVGIMLGSELLGIAWEKIGWLVAALGVGLGFGLQEIFANFISGIIILVERPIRIGDVVTINGQTGKVAQIRMRATTLTDADQKELIIPNKMIMTNQLVNWTLTDSISRLVIPVSVSRGNDVELVIRTLLEVAQQHPHVMKTPAPGAFFVAFGDKLDFELRCFVSELSKRGSTQHDLNMAIERQFRAQGIEVTPPFTDVRLSQMPGHEVNHLALPDGQA